MSIAVSILSLLVPGVSAMPYALVRSTSDRSIDRSIVVISSFQIATFLSRGAIAGSYAVLYIYTPELYSTSIRSSALGTAAALAKLASILTP